MTTFRAYRDHTEKFGDYVAFQHEFRDHMRSEMISDVLTLSSFFDRQGLKAGDVYTIMLPPLTEGMIVFFALNRLGVRVNFIHPTLPPGDLQQLLTETKSKGIAVLDRIVAPYAEVIDDQRLDVLICSYETYMRADKLTTPFHESFNAEFHHVKRFSYAKILAEYASIPPPPETTDPKDVAVYLQGGGTTGKRQTIMLTNANLNAAVSTFIDIIGEAEYPGIDTALNCMPIFHIYGLVNSSLLALSRGIKLISIPKFDAERYIRLMHVNRVIEIRGVPNMFRKLLASPQWDGPHLRNLKSVTCGGDNVTASLRGAIDYTLQKNGSATRASQGYGMTECTTAVLLHHSPGKENDADSLGTPFGGLRVEIWNDDQQPVNDGEIGEIAISGPTVMRGYLNDDDLDDVGLYIDGEGRRWMLSGDLGYRKGDLYYFTGRKKRVIIISGFNAYPIDIEKVALATGTVKEACAVQGFDDGGKKIIRLFVVPEDGVQEDVRARLPERLFRICEENLESLTRPRDIRVLAELPRTRVGKVDFMRLTQNTPADKIFG